MADATFNEPRLALNRIYTRRGDTGTTGLVGGQRVGKDDLRIDCYGTVDELNSIVGVVRTTVLESPALADLGSQLLRIQHELFNLGSILATKPEDVHPKQARVTEGDIEALESEIDRMNTDLEMLRSFVLPGGARANAELHVARTVCRRAERATVALSRVEDVPPETIGYLNRLSDYLFVASRWASHKLGVPEVLWEPNQAASAQD